VACEIGAKINIQDMIISHKYPVKSMVTDMFLVYPRLLERLINNALKMQDTHPSPLLGKIATPIE
jgi:hypothetical protein